MALDDLETLTLLDKFFNLSWFAGNNLSEEYYKWEAFDEFGKLKYLWIWSIKQDRLFFRSANHSEHMTNPLPLIIEKFSRGWPSDSLTVFTEFHLFIEKLKEGLDED